MAHRALKTYRAGEPEGSKTKPPKAVADAMTEHLGKHGRIFEGGEYHNLPAPVVAALLKDKAIEEA